MDNGKMKQDVKFIVKLVKFCNLVYSSFSTILYFNL